MASKGQEKSIQTDLNKYTSLGPIIDVLSLISPDLLQKWQDNTELDTSLENINIEPINNNNNNILENFDADDAVENMDDGDDVTEQEERRGNGNNDILHKIVQNLLTGKRKDKWTKHKLGVDILFTQYLSSAQEIYDNFTVQEMDMNASIYCTFTGCKMMFNKSTKKNMKANEISQKFGDKSTIQIRNAKCTNASRLSVIVKNT